MLDRRAPSQPAAADVGALFLLVFVILLGAFQLFHGVIAVDHYNMNFDVARFPGSGQAPLAGQDFAGTWLGASNLARGESLYHGRSDEIANPRAQTYVYPPLAAVLYRPLAGMSVGDAYRLHVLILAGAYGVTVWTLGRLFRFTGVHYAYAVALGLLTCPFHFEYERGNAHSPVIGLLVLGYYLGTRRRDPVTAGFLLAVAALLKLYPAFLLLYWAARRRLAIVLWTLGFATVLILCTGGPTLYADYLRLILSYHTRVREGDPDNHSTLSVLLMLAGSEADPAAVGIAAVIVNVALLLVPFLLALRHRNLAGQSTEALVYSALLIAANVFPNRSYRYTLTFLPFPLFALIDSFRKPAIGQRLGRALVPLALAMALLANGVMMAPAGGYHSSTSYNLLYDVLPWSVIRLLRQSWFALMLLYAGILAMVIVDRRRPGSASGPNAPDTAAGTAPATVEPAEGSPGPNAASSEPRGRLWCLGNGLRWCAVAAAVWYAGCQASGIRF
ncbi:MAG: DUF2029 domain-containing protein [Planctomycetes bacterium]|nr:DUF2029 domain-containing protein [Planctomycetota bacterium]